MDRVERGRRAQIAQKTKRDPSDVTDEEWEVMALLMRKPGAAETPARELEVCEVINAVRDLVRSGCGWRMLPIHFGHCRTVYGCSASWPGGSSSRPSTTWR